MNTENIKNHEDKANNQNIPFCEYAYTAEHSRLWEDDDPCDGNLGQKN